MKKYNRKSDGHQIYDEKGRVVGVVVGDTFYKTIAPNHYLRKPPAISNSTCVLEAAEKAGAIWVEVKDRSNGTRYRATIDHIRNAGFEFDRGYGLQIALTLTGWIKNGPNLVVQIGLPL